MKQFIKDIFSKETLLYIFFGIGTSLVDFITFTFLVYIHTGTISANNIAWCLAVVFAFVTNKQFVFKSGISGFKGIVREFVMFVLARVLTLICSDIILYIADKYHLNVVFAKVFAMVFTVVVNYIFSKMIIFKKENANEVTY